EEYLIVQQIYRGWSLLGIVIVAALLSAAGVTLSKRRSGAPFYLALTATLCIALSLVVFFSVTFPTNTATNNWTILPAEWEDLRRRWEYSHAVGALLYLVALASLVLSILVARDER